ncbi:FAD/NAD(P)-binding protein [Streptomyces sp. NBC_00536]|uniref:FAD/NAD(P)-binding protein n=1 Tax=Streptomyces sp. NBC_00536 TaxID=2975769 RepID=UPI002E808512|nr:FAD/NAD(P)-binding protein [Streptomyces sp. NBC_00536]WUC83270.1 FAD/NAD(P)-binding protein [Streptomyces sp. NBC_00536]
MYEAADREGRAHRIAVVGGGPRGMAVLERLAARLADGPSPEGPVEIHLIDARTLAGGRVWRADQPDWFLMNTAAGEITMFSGPPDGGPTRPGAGPSFAQWWTGADPSSASPEGYAPRALYGRYLEHVLHSVERSLPSGARLHRVLDSVDDMERTAAGYALSLARGGTLTVDKVVLATGHTLPALGEAEQRLSDFARERPHLRYIRGDSAADMPLDSVPATAVVGIIGLGLSFIDVVFALTVGRGGEFAETGAGDGRVVYRPGGREPVLVAGSRSGMPVLSRGFDQRPAGAVRKPVLFTEARVLSGADRESLDFRRDVFPLLAAEMDLAHHATSLRLRRGPAAEAGFLRELTAVAEHGDPDVCGLAARHGIGEHEHFDFRASLRPFAGQDFPDQEAFQKELTQQLRTDISRTERGNHEDPFKAAVQVIRDTRSVIRSLVDYGGLQARSHEHDLIRWFSPASVFLAAGPPLHRARCILALIESGVLRVVGPGAGFAADPACDRFVMESPQVGNSRTEVDVLIDGRVPIPDVATDTSPLTRRLLARGIWTEFVNRRGPEPFHSGGVAITEVPFHPINLDGVPDTGLYVIGIPTEHTRWGTQVGNGTPGPWNKFIRHADAIAEHALTRRAR